MFGTRGSLREKVVYGVCKTTSPALLKRTREDKGLLLVIPLFFSLNVVDPRTVRSFPFPSYRDTLAPDLPTKISAAFSFTIDSFAPNVK